MKRSALAACFLCLTSLSVSGPATAQAPPIDSQLEAIRTKYGLPAPAAAVVKNGEIVAKGAVGTRVLDTDNAVTIDDRFHLGSDAKAMTATLVGMMVDEGKFKWTTTIGEVLGPDMPGLNPAFAAITLEQLLSHSSGIPSDNEEMAKLYESPDGYDYTLTDYRKRIIADWGKSHEPKVPEGSPFQYANFGYVIVGAMLEKATGQPWEHLITRRIFEPLGLKTTGLGPQATFGRYDAPVGHRVGDDGTVTPMPWGLSADAPPVMGPAGIAHMSILDFATWAAWNAGEGQRGPALVKPQTLKKLHEAHVRTPVIENPKPGTPKTGEYAFGWGLAKMDLTPKPVITHNGSNSLNLAMILLDTDNDLGIVVTTNIPGQKADTALLEMAKALYGEYGPR
jgi:CubicO group peptidase (beta-lactamase class C family)